MGDLVPLTSLGSADAVTILIVIIAMQAPNEGLRQVATRIREPRRTASFSCFNAVRGELQCKTGELDRRSKGGRAHESLQPAVHGSLPGA